MAGAWVAAAMRAGDTRSPHFRMLQALAQRVLVSPCAQSRAQPHVPQKLTGSIARSIYQSAVDFKSPDSNRPLKLSKPLNRLMAGFV
jgi:hypothetical protein